MESDELPEIINDNNSIYHTIIIPKTTTLREILCKNNPKYPQEKIINLTTDKKSKIISNKPDKTIPQIARIISQSGNNRAQLRLAKVLNPPSKFEIQHTTKLEAIKQEITHKKTLHRLIFERDIATIRKILKMFKNNKNILKEILNTQDARTNTPLILLALLRDKEKFEDELIILMEILDYEFVDPKIKNMHKQTAMEIAISNKDYEFASVLYDYITNRKYKKISDKLAKASESLKNIPNFYIEIEWKVNIPLLGFLCPNDICKVWKFGNKFRLDYSNNFTRKKSPKSFLFYSESGENYSYNLDRNDKTYYNPFEPLEDDEKAFIISEMIVSNDNKAKEPKFNFWKNMKVKNFTINQSKSYFTNKEVCEKIHENFAKKYEANFCLLSENRKEKKLLKEILSDKNKYFKEENCENNSENTIEYKEKKYKAFIWIAENFPINSNHFIELFQTMSSANEFMKIFNEFIKKNEIQEIIIKNGFPIKLKFPINFICSISINFLNFKELNEINFGQVDNLFVIPNDFHKISRKKANNLKENRHKRMFYSKI